MSGLKGVAKALRRAVTIVLALAVAVLGVLTSTPTASAQGVAPLPGPIVGEFDPPKVAWNAGHRGLDLAGFPGESVVAPAAGVVTFVGQVGGVPVVVVSHGERRSTFEPVVATVSVGQEVEIGDVLGRLQAGHACSAAACLHWGLKRGDTYLDPRLLLAAADLRLLPAGSAVAADASAAQRAADGAMSQGMLLNPVGGGIGSPFGMRFHPILHILRLHAGVDLHAGCGTPIRAAADGVVTHVGFDVSGGNRLVVDVGAVQGRALVTSYLHAEGYRVAMGDRVNRGEVVGWVGSTGLSTACHLHFSVKADGVQVDPAPYLGLG